MAEFANISFVQGTSALKIEHTAHQNVVRLEQEDFCRSIYQQESEPEPITYCDYVRECAREAAEVIAHGSLETTMPAMFTRPQAAVLGTIIGALTLFCMFFA
ncbi:MAG: hypothetical protein Q4D06_01815 [Coriobacteriia bacterium]|nr:hypothetical protein [Coriobacteriia bacterium]